MIDTLNPTQIQECKDKFGLSYHVDFANHCQKSIGFEGKDVLEVGGSLPKEFVLNYLHVKSWSAIETSEYNDSFEALNKFSSEQRIFHNVTESHRINLGLETEYSDPYNLFVAKIEDLPSEHYQKYDLIFSISAFEHIHKFPQALEKMFLALKPSGKLFSMFCPIWSAHDGHHIPAVIDKYGKEIKRGKDCPIPPWGHLIMFPGEMCEYLYKRIDKQTADLLVYYIYNSNHINRFFTEDYLAFINQSWFKIESLEKIFQVKVQEKLQRQLEKVCPKRKYFNNNGLRVILSKPSQSEIKDIANQSEENDTPIKMGNLFSEKLTIF